MSRSTLKLLGAAFLCALILGPSSAQDADPAAKVSEAFQRLAQAQGDELWDQAMSLEGLGASAAKEIARQLDAATSPTVQLAAAKALLSMSGAEEQRGVAVRAVKAVIQGSAPRGLRVLACDLLTEYGLKSEVAPMMRALDALTDPYVKIHLLRALHHRGRHPKASRDLKLFLQSTDFGVQAEAALALASPEIGNVELVRPLLRKLKDEPTERGRRAKAYLEIDDQLSKLEKYEGLENESELLKARDREIARLKGDLVKAHEDAKKGGGGAGPEGSSAFPGGKMMEEIFTRVREGYVNAKKTDVQDLIDHAATGLVENLDPFSAYMSQKSLEEFNTGMEQRYGGVGAVVQIDRRTGYLTIAQPFYGNPAFQAGLRTLDKVIKVEGTDTKGKRVDELVKVLKGPEGTPVRVTVRPFLGGPDAEKTITRKEIVLKSVHTAMLPGNIGYLSLQQFGHLAVDEVEAGLKELEGQGMQGLIFDLRGNPGGLLNAAVLIGDKFLNDDQLVVYSQGREGTPYGKRSEDGGPRVRQARVAQPKHPDYPLVILVDENSASASEIVSGALQAHGRAELVGETTFGKGSVQNIFPLMSVGGKAALRMTIAHYYLPDGRCIHRERDVATWRFLERMRAAIHRWQQDGVVSEAQAKKMMDRYENTPGGVEPDYEVLQPELSAPQQTAYAAVLDKQLVEDWVAPRWAANKDLFHKLAESDGFDVSKYPDFEQLWEQSTKAIDNEEAKQAFAKEDLRVLTRAMVRRLTADDLERVLVGDYQQDRQLQAGILVVAGRIGLDVAKVQPLAFLKERFPKGVERTRKLAQKDDGKKDEKKRDFK
ncbi:MAG: S41 family peptidase [Planctomycetota bacterium]